jgi:hypothetical protein
MFTGSITSGALPPAEARPSAFQRARVMIVQKFRQLLAQALIALALMAEHDGVLEQYVLKILRQLAP